MKWSLRVGRLAGIDIYIHLTFLLLLAWIGYSFYQYRQAWDDVLRGLGLIAALFVIIVLHELGHALAARRYGIRTRDITLLPIGGVARLERMPEDPRQELVVALAGPAVNVVLAIVVYLLLQLGEELPSLDQIMDVTGPFLGNLLKFNVFMAGFNLLPAFPMDGGRVLRALLAMKLDYVRATQVAATVGQGMAILFAVFGLFGNPMLLFIALFVWMGAAAEASMAQMRAGLSGIPISRAMITHFQALAPTQTVAEALQWVLAGFQQDFPVVENGHVVGVLTREDLLRAVAQGGMERHVTELMQRDFLLAHPGEMLETVFTRMQRHQCQALPVVKDGKLVGVITMDVLGRFLMLVSAMRSAAPR